MTNYIKEIKKQFRDRYNFEPDRMKGDEPIFNHIPDGVYPIEIDGKTDNVKITNNSISCCNFED